MAIPGATGGSYDLTGADIGHEILVSVQASNSAGSAPGRPRCPRATPSTADPPHAVAAPAVTGSAQDGGTLSADTGSFTGTDPLAYTYQWQRCDADGTNCADIAGATTTTYDAHAPTDIGGTPCASSSPAPTSPATTPAISTPTAAVTAAPPASTTAPSIAGVTVDGQTLTADHGSFSGTGPLDYTYQWQRCDLDGSNCVDLAGATGSTYELVSSDVGGAMRVIVTATNGAGSDSATSSATTEVLAARARQRHPAVDLRHAARRPHADRRPRHLERHARRSTSATSGSAATPTARAASTSSAPPATPTRWCRATSTMSSTVVVTAQQRRRQRAERLGPDRAAPRPPRRQHGRPGRLAARSRTARR